MPSVREYVKGLSDQQLQDRYRREEKAQKRDATNTVSGEYKTEIKAEQAARAQQGKKR